MGYPNRATLVNGTIMRIFDRRIQNRSILKNRYSSETDSWSKSMHSSYIGGVVQRSGSLVWSHNVWGSSSWRLDWYWTERI